MSKSALIFKLWENSYDDQDDVEGDDNWKKITWLFAKMSLVILSGLSTGRCLPDYQADEYKQLQKGSEVWVKLSVSKDQFQLPLPSTG